MYIYGKIRRTCRHYEGRRFCSSYSCLPHCTFLWEITRHDDWRHARSWRWHRGGCGSYQHELKTGGKSKRRKLRHYDLMPSQVLNPMGASGIEEVDLDRLWKLMGTGNKAAMFFSELCDEDKARHRVAISRNCQVLRACIERLETEEAKLVIKEGLYRRAKAEWDDLLPHLKTLDFQEFVQNEGGSIRSIAYKKRGGGGTRSQHDVEAAAKKLHVWLSTPTSPLRSVLAFLSSSGLFYVGQVHEQCCRAYLQQGVSKEDFATTISQGRDIGSADMQELAELLT